MRDDLGRDGLTGCGNRGGGSNLHSDVATAVLELVGSGVDALDIERHEDADLAATMNVGGDAASLDDSSASEVHVLAERVDGIGEHVLDGLALCVDSLQSLNVLDVGSHGGTGDLLGVALELLVHADEVGLAVELDDSALGRVVGNDSHNGALVGGTADLLGGSGQTTGTKNVNGLVHIAIGLDESLLALHHAGVGHFAELFDHCSGNCSHGCSFLSSER